MAEKTGVSDTADVLEHHLTAFGEQDMAELLADYTDDSVLITNSGTYRGLDEIEGMMSELFAEFGEPGTDFALDEQVVEGEVAYLVWHAETPDNVYEFATDTFVVRDGVIEVQTFAATVEPKD